MSNDLLSALEQLNQFAAAQSRQDHYRERRTPEESDVMDNFYNILSKSDPTLNHTVESMVSDLRARVGLDSRKTEGLALSRRAAYAAEDEAVLDEASLKEKLKEFSIKYFLERDHGLSSVETMIEDFKMQPGGLKAIEFFSRDKIRDILREIVAAFPKDNPSASMQTADVFTMPAADKASPIGEKANIGMGGSSGITSR